MRIGMRGTIGVAVALASAACVPAGAVAAEPAPGVECREQQAFVDGDAEVVAERLPDGYIAMTNPASGRPVVFARGIHCEQLTLGGRTAPATMGSIGVLIDSPDGRGCGSALPGAGEVKGDLPPVCNWYVLRWIASDRRVVDWLRAGTPGFPVSHVADLGFELGSAEGPGGAPFSIRAGGPAPFTIDGEAREGEREVSVRGGYWADTPQGTIEVALTSDDLRAGDASGVVRAPAGSELARLMGAEERPFAAAFAGFSTVRAGHGVYRKQVLPPPGSTAGFAGSCDIQGDVHFDTPAKNDPQPLVFSYAGEGTCTGTLDGRWINAEPMRIWHRGRSYGGCRSAKTVTPSVGAITFASGRVLPFTLDFTTSSIQVSGTMYGERSGIAPGSGSFATPRTNAVAVAQACAGDGLTDAPLDLEFETRTPLVNEPSAQARRGLRVAVAPRVVPTGRRTTFGIRVTTSDGRPVPGAAVRFFGRRVVTGSDGRAAIAATLHRPGAHPVRAKLRGFRGGRSAVVVRRR